MKINYIKDMGTCDVKKDKIDCPPLTLEYIKNNELKQNIIDSSTDSKKCVDQEKCSLLNEEKCNSNNNCTWYKYSIINDIHDKYSIINDIYNELINKNIYDLDEKISLSNNKLTPKDKKI